MLNLDESPEVILQKPNLIENEAKVEPVRQVPQVTKEYQQSHPMIETPPVQNHVVSIEDTFQNLKKQQIQSQDEVQIKQIENDMKETRNM